MYCSVADNVCNDLVQLAPHEKLMIEIRYLKIPKNKNIGAQGHNAALRAKLCRIYATTNRVAQAVLASDDVAGFFEFEAGATRNEPTALNRRLAASNQRG